MARLLDIKEVHKDFQSLTNVYSAQSFYENPIKAYQWGEGSTRLLLWSQMHGNEPTATRALQQLVPMLHESKELKAKLRLIIIPILNPDGALVFSRYNGMGMDINRDAQRLISPESQFLNRVVQDFKPHWAFNLHDQRSIFSVGEAPRPATISFLAPSPDYERSVNTARAQAMRLIGAMYEEMENTLPGHCGRYSDEYYPRAWGDALQRQNIATVLIESGAYYDDMERIKAQELNKNLIYKALNLIAHAKVENRFLETYYRIPENEKRLRDVKYTNVNISWQGQHFTADVSMMLRETYAENKLQYQWEWDEVGDLSMLAGLKQEEGGYMEWKSFPVYGELAEFSYRKEGHKNFP